VIDATGRLQDMICRKHDKELEMFCITDQQCICVRCKEYEHKNHNTVSTAAQRTEKQVWTERDWSRRNESVSIYLLIY